MTIAILYICTGRYNQFFKGFYESCEKYFLFGKANKEYFVFTDDLELSRAANVHLIFKKCEGFPYDSLFRFKMFKNVIKLLEKFDYIYFFNSNAEFVAPVNEEILPKANTELVCGLWPIHRKFFTSYHFYPYERNKFSLAYISPHHKPYYYFMGGLNGGKSAAYIDLINTLADNIQKDFEKGIIATVHDESHLNKYLRSHPCTNLSKEYCCPEEWVEGFEPKMIFRNKVKIDSYFSKGRDKTIFGKLKEILRMLKHAIIWYV